MTRDIKIYDTPTALTLAAAQQFVKIGHQTLAQKKHFCVSLSGGNTPRTLFSLLVQPEFRSQLDWSRVDFFWGDERCVPPDHPDSDFGMANTTLLSHLQDFSPRIYRLEGERSPMDAAKKYEHLLRTYFGQSPRSSFDLLLLGMGEDAHTASLFPGTAAIQEPEHWVVAHFVPKLNVWRLTLTPVLLNLAVNTFFLASGSNKSAALCKVLTGESQVNLYPAQSIQPVNGQLTWLVDREAASELPAAF
jgi:6-phosphogluconolactonase